MTDGDRIYPVNKLILHHSAGPELTDESDYDVQAWFSSVGYSRGYNSGAINPYHTFPNSDQVSYAMAQYSLHRYTVDGNKYGWRVVTLINDPMNNVAWHAGNWPVNQSSVGIEVCGNFLDHELDEKGLMCIADFFRSMDAGLGGQLKIYGHKDVSLSGTQCPGQIENQIDTLVDMINNQDAWNQKLWPAPVQPVDTRPEWLINATNIPTKTMFAKVDGTQLVDLVSLAVLKTFSFDQDFSISGVTSVKGKKYYISTYSVQKNIGNGISEDYLTDVDPKPIPQPQPTPEPIPAPVTPSPVVPSVDPAPVSPVTPSNDNTGQIDASKPENLLLVLLTILIKGIINFVVNVYQNFTKKGK